MTISAALSACLSAFDIDHGGDDLVRRRLLRFVIVPADVYNMTLYS